MIQIENNLAILAVDEKAAEICSFKLKSDNLERMWQGNPEYWAGRNPILFPMVTNTYNGIQHINGKDYHMGNHGILRNAMFTCKSKDETSIVMTYSSNEKTKELYPFDFTIDVRYELVESKVKIIYTITNESDLMMPFGFGLHPAFNCPVETNEKFEDYCLEFSNPENVKGILGPLSLTNEKVIPCDYSLFIDNPTILFENVISEHVTLHNDKHCIKVGYAGMPFIAFWTKQNAPYMCIEPWHSHGDFDQIDREFEDRPCTLKCEPHKSWTTGYYIEIVK